MRIFARADGTVVGVASGVDPGDAPVFSIVSYTQTLDFDAETNGQLADALAANLAPFHLSGGVLTRNGTVVTPNSPGQFVTDKQQSAQAATQIDAFLQSLDGGTNLTAAQVQTAIKILLRIARFVLRWIARHG